MSCRLFALAVEQHLGQVFRIFVGRHGKAAAGRIASAIKALVSLDGRMPHQVGDRQGR